LATYILEGTSELYADKKKAPVLICPAGGYAYTSERESEPVGMRFLAAGFNAFILRYRTAPSRHPKPLLDLSRAMWIIRENADKWNLDPEKIAVCGFSAGGHLAASLGVFWNELYISEAIGMPEGINKPNGLILGYPVITSGKYAHRGSFSNLLGRDATAEQKEGMSLELHVKNQVPPTFLWHTFHDLAVPVENSLLFAQALRQSGIPFELHIFPDGPHGLSLCDEETAVNNPDLINPHAANWMPLCIEWLKELFSS
ncbi:MAG: alpha/beta hydrolase, partial [Clostridiales bacterium]|nr:alpha/beta hydrolase [Clostridiales bacterium]